MNNIVKVTAWKNEPGSLFRSGLLSWYSLPLVGSKGKKLQC